MNHLRLILRILNESVLSAVQAIVSNKTRTILSTLGISIGIFCIITVFAIVDSLEKNIRSSVQSLGSDVIFVQKWPMAFDAGYPWWKYLNRPVANYREFQQLSNEFYDQAIVSMHISYTGKLLKYGSNTLTNTTMIAATMNFDKIRSFEISNGRYFSETEMAIGTNSAVIGDNIASNLFGTEDPIGKTINNSGRKVTVVGVFKKEGTSLLSNSMDEVVLLPLNFVKNFIPLNNDRYEPTISVKPLENVSIDYLKSELQRKMRAIRKLHPREEDNFALNEISLLTNLFDTIFDVIWKVGFFIGIFSILVGGFGVANIMFVSVKERTNLIGIQKSLGAKRYFILIQFLTEAVLLSIVGAFFGILLVEGLVLVASNVMGFPIFLSLKNILTGLGFALAIGLLAGMIPAWTAARLDPVEAIRSK